MLDFLVNNWNIFFILYLAQGCFGIALFELSLHLMRRSINVVEERDSQFPSWRRLDVQYWKRSAFYPGAFLYMVPRCACLINTVISMTIGMRLCYVGSGLPFDKPLSGIRRRCIEHVIAYHSWMLCLLSGYKPKHVYKEEKHVDYSKYLGPNWRENKFKGKRVSTQVSNHIGIIDVFLSLSHGQYCSFVASIHVKKFTGVGSMFVFILLALQGVFLDRAATQEQLDTTVNTITDRQELIETAEEEWPPITIYAEGAVTNGKNLSRFKRGSFVGLKAVRPQIMKYHW